MRILIWLWENRWLRLNIIVVVAARAYLLFYPIIKGYKFYMGLTSEGEISKLESWRPRFSVVLFIILIWLYNFRAPSLNIYVEDYRRTEQFRLALLSVIWVGIVGICYTSKRKIIIMQTRPLSSGVFLKLVDRSLYYTLQMVVKIETAIRPVILCLLLIFIIGSGHLILVLAAEVEGICELGFSLLEVTLRVLESFILVIVITYNIKSRRNR